jgi:hypothetical protein
MLPSNVFHHQILMACLFYLSGAYYGCQPCTVGVSFPYSPFKLRRCSSIWVKEMATSVGACQQSTALIVDVLVSSVLSHPTCFVQASPSHFQRLLCYSVAPNSCQSHTLLQAHVAVGIKGNQTPLQISLQLR